MYRFHLAFPVHDLEATGRFYVELLGASEVGEQATLFLTDPSGNALEFKSFRDANQVFAT